MRDAFKTFVKEEDGVETIEFIGLVVVAAALIGVIATIGSQMYSKASNAQSTMNNKLDEIQNVGK